jgi:hypothetical protein
MKRLLRKIFKTKELDFYLINGTRYEIDERYSKFLNEDVEIISTALSQDFSKYGHTEHFVFIITYKK